MSADRERYGAPTPRRRKETETHEDEPASRANVEDGALVWTPVRSVARWMPPPGPPRVARAAIAGLGWLVATQIGDGWSTTFVPDDGAANPPHDAAPGSFRAAMVDWGLTPRTTTSRTGSARTRRAKAGTKKPATYRQAKAKARSRAKPKPKAKTKT